MAANHRYLSSSNHDDNRRPAEDVDTIMCNDLSSVTNLVDGYLLEFFS